MVAIYWLSQIRVVKQLRKLKIIFLPNLRYILGTRALVVQCSVIVACHMPPPNKCVIGSYICHSFEYSAEVVQWEIYSLLACNACKIYSCSGPSTGGCRTEVVSQLYINTKAGNLTVYTAAWHSRFELCACKTASKGWRFFCYSARRCCVEFGTHLLGCAV